MLPDHGSSVRRAGARRLMAACSVVVLMLGSNCSRPPSVVRDAPVAVILLPTGSGAELVLVDLDRFEIAGRVGLRSLALSLDGDPRARTVVIAQCGGIGTSADSVAGVYDVDRGGSVSYLDLEAPNPTFAAMVTHDRALLVHGFEQPQGLVATVVDLTTREVVRSIHLPATAGRPERVGERVFLPLNPQQGPVVDGLADVGRSELVVVTGEGVDTVTNLPVGAFTVLGADVTQSGVLCVGLSQRTALKPEEWRIFRVDPQSGEVLSEAVVPGVERGIFEGCRWNDEVVLADADGLDLNDPGSRILVLDAPTLTVRRTIEIDGMPAAIETWRNSLLVVDGVRGRLLLFEPGESSPSRSLELGGDPGGVADLVVFDQPLPSWR